MGTTVSTKIKDTLLDEIDAVADEDHDGNRSEAFRELVRKGLEYDHLEAERDDLQRQLRERNRENDKVTEIVEYVEEEKEIQQRERSTQEARELQRLEAGLLTKIRWRLVGRNQDEMAELRET